MDNVRKRAALYARFSTTMQREESITAQVRAMKIYCEDRGWEVVKVYKDMGISGTTDKRPAFQDMISDSDKKLFDVLLVHKLDRFCRNRYDAAIYKSRLQKNGVKLCSVSENIDDSPESILLESLLEGIAEYYSANLAKESIKGMKENAYQCRHTGGMTPLGYDLDKEKHLVLNPKEAEVVVLIYAMFLEGHTHRYMADYLNSKGFLTKTGRPFSSTSFDSILRNEKYTGTYVFNKTASKGIDKKRSSRKYKPDEEIIRVENGCPTIIPKDIFDEVQSKLGIKYQRHSYCKDGKYMYICSGKIVCGCCGKLMTGYLRKANPDRMTYVCTKKKAECGNKRELSRDLIDEYAVKVVERQIRAKADNTDEINKFETFPRDSEPFFLLIQKYIKSIVVTRETVTFLITNGESDNVVKKYRHKREKFDCKVKWHRS